LPVALQAAALFAVGVMAYGIFRLLAGDELAGLRCIVGGWFLKDATRAADQRVRLIDGLRGLSVRDVMLTSVATIPGYLPLSELVAERSLRGGYRTYPVVRGETVVGLLSIRSVVALSPEERERTSVQAVMARIGEAIVVDPGEPLIGAMARMARGGVGRLLVIEDGRLAGLLSRSSVFRYMRMRLALAR
jgi:CBS domain-containing protein